MNESLRELCRLVADLGVTRATELSQEMRQLVATERHGWDSNSTFVIFSFMNWTAAVGMWSSLANVHLRRDLMAESMSAFVLRIAGVVAQSDDPSDVASTAVDIESWLKRYLQGFLDRCNALEESGVSAGANVSVLYALECIQERMSIDDTVMERVELQPLFSSVAEIEEVAGQVNLAAGKRGRP